MQAYCSAGRWRETEPVLQVGARRETGRKRARPACVPALPHAPAGQLFWRATVVLTTVHRAATLLALLQEMRDRGVPPTEHIYRSLIWCNGRHQRAGEPRRHGKLVVEPALLWLHQPAACP